MSIHLKWILAICCHCFSWAYVWAQENNTLSDTLSPALVDTLPPFTKGDSLSNTRKGKDNKMNTNPNNNTSNNHSKPKDNPAKEKVILLDTIGKGEQAEQSLVKKKKAHSPKKAALLAIIPGAGQIYNGKYWKLPIVYGGIGGLGYWGISSYSEYRKYKRAYNEQGDDNPNTNYTHPNNPNASLRELQLQKNFYRSQYEYGLIFGVLFYGLTVADAYVDAHLRTFDVSDDLSLKLSPKVEILPSWATQQTQTNLSLSLKFTPRGKKDIKTAIAHW